MISPMPGPFFEYEFLVEFSQSSTTLTGSLRNTSCQYRNPPTEKLCFAINNCSLHLLQSLLLLVFYKYYIPFYSTTLLYLPYPTILYPTLPTLLCSALHSTLFYQTVVCLSVLYSMLLHSTLSTVPKSKVE